MMKIGGMLKNSLIDYPGKISCVIFISGCNFRCPYCHNPELINKHEEVISSGAFIDFIDSRKSFLDAVVISGGEPTLAKEIYDFCKTVKKTGFKVKLDTNGSQPDVIKNLIKDNLVDYIAMDIKTDPFCYTSYIAPDIDGKIIIESINIIMDSGIEHEFRTTCVKPFIDIKIIKNILNRIKGADLYALQQFRNTKVLDPDFFYRQNRIFIKDELSEFKVMAEKKVKKCIIR